MSEDTIQTPDSAPAVEPVPAPAPVAAPAPTVAVPAPPTAAPKARVSKPWQIAIAAAVAVLLLGCTFVSGVMVGSHARGGRGDLPAIGQLPNGQVPPGMGGQLPPGTDGQNGAQRGHGRNRDQRVPNGAPDQQQAPQPNDDSTSS